VAWLACAGRAPPLERARRPAPRVLFDRVSPFARVLVVDDGPQRAMRFGSPAGADQSAIVRDDPRAVPVEYVRHALLGLAYHGHPARVLMVGLGGGTFTTVVHRALPDVAIDAVEIDPVVVEAARAWFGLREDERYRIHVADAATWMAGDGEPYDYILLDAYAGDDIPGPLATESFFRAVRRRLAPGGVVALNLADLPGPGAPAARAFRAVFVPFECRRMPIDGNVLVFAAAEARAIDRASVLRWTADWDARGATTFHLQSVARSPADPACGMLP
jgi:spermidine synthase